MLISNDRFVLVHKSCTRAAAAKNYIKTAISACWPSIETDRYEKNKVG